MRAGRPEVADILLKHFESYCQNWPVSADQRRVVHNLVACRTASLGGHVLRCDRCDHREISYNSCRNRHCPKCQVSAGAEWVEKRCEDLLPVPYFHVVFTLPEELSLLALQNKSEVYGMLIKVAALTLSTIAADRQHLGAKVGVIAVLHTWTQTLRHHPHVHCVLPGGGLDNERHEWIPSCPDFFLPVRVLSAFFRNRFLERLDELWETGELEFHGQLQPLADRRGWTELLSTLKSKQWVVYCKPPFGGPSQVLKYLARYTHRVAITSSRIRSVAGGRVTFDWRDSARGHVRRTMCLPAAEFIRRFLLHVLPKGFHRIRYFGFLSNRNRKEAIGRIKALLSGLSIVGGEDNGDLPIAAAGREHNCPHCTQGALVVVAELGPMLGRRRPAAPVTAIPP